MRQIKFTLLLFISVINGYLLFAQKAQKASEALNPLDLEFQRLAVRRFIFSNNIPVSEFVLSEIVSFTSMHPAFLVSSSNEPLCDTSFHPKISKGQLVLDKASGKVPASFYVGGINPYDTYEIDINSIKLEGNKETEIGFEFAQESLRDRVQVIIKSSIAEQGIYLRIYKDAAMNVRLNIHQRYPMGLSN